MRVEKRPHEWLGGVLEVSGLAPLAYTYKINKRLLKGYWRCFFSYMVRKALFDHFEDIARYPAALKYQCGRNVYEVTLK